MKRPRVPLAALACALALAPAARAQTVADPTLDVELVTGGLLQPTTMAFVAPDDMLVLEKNLGRVRRVVGGVLSPTPVLSVPVNFQSERGLLGIAVDTESPPHVFLYYTEATSLGGTPIANRVYRYDWNAAAAQLQNPALVLDLPVLTGPNHDGGVILLGPPGEAPGVGDGSLLYAVIGDLNRSVQLSNVPTGPPPDDSAAIFRVRQDGSAAPGNPFTPYCSVTTPTTCTSDAGCPSGEVCHTQVARYFAYGVRNSFGLTLDPVTGALWDTENGPSFYDEVNYVTPGMNSGWSPLMGPDARDPQSPGVLFDMPGAGSTYSDPEFSWLTTIAPTAILIPYQSSLGPAHDGVALVGDVNTQKLYRLPLNAARTGIDVSGVAGLDDLVADDATERDAFAFGDGFGVISDLDVGPDGHVYVTSISSGAIYRVSGSSAVPALPGWAVAVLVLLLGAGGFLYARARSSSAAGR